MVLCENKSPNLFCAGFPKGPERPLWSYVEGVVRGNPSKGFPRPALSPFSGRAEKGGPRGLSASENLLLYYIKIKLSEKYSHCFFQFPVCPSPKKTPAKRPSPLESLLEIRIVYKIHTVLCENKSPNLFCVGGSPTGSLSGPER